MNKKIIISIVAILILVAGIGAYFIFQKPVPEPQTGKCGDGICDEFEKANPDLCQQDCQARETPTTTTAAVSQDIDLLYSFYAGVDALAFTDETKLEKVFKIAKEDFKLNYLKTGVGWRLIEKMEGRYDWSETDKIANLAKKYNLSLIPFFVQTMIPTWAQKSQEENWWQVPKDTNVYANFIYQFVKRYKDSMSIRYIELENEVNAPGLWPDTAQYVAEVDNAVYDKVKAAYSDVNVCSASFHQPAGLGGISLAEDNNNSQKFLREYLNSLNKIDCFSIHDYGRIGFTETDNQYKFASQYDLESNYRQELDKYSKFKDTSIIDTECAHEISSVFGNDENLSAALLVQGYIVAHTKGIVKGRWCQAITRGVLPMENGVTDISQNKYYTGYYAFKTLRSIMLNYPKYVKRVAGKLNDNGYWLLEFKSVDGNNQLYVAFVPIRFPQPGQPPKSLPASQSATINIGVSKTASITNMKGEKSTKNADSSGNITLTTGGEPTYIEIKK